MTDPLQFRLATDADVDALVALIESAYRGDASRAGWTTEADLLEGQRTDPTSLRAVLAETDSRIVLALAGTELVACANIRRHGGEHCYFGLFSVRPSLQGGGVGRRLLAECERMARDELGCRIMDMSVIVQRPELIAWYVRRGYHDTGRRKPFPYGDLLNGKPLRDDLAFVVMEKTL